MSIRINFRTLLACSLLVSGSLGITPLRAETSGTSVVTVWNCTGSYCPWGSPLSGQALVWPSSLVPVTARLGYTVSEGIYLPADSANGITIRITAGTATLYAGLPTANSHRGVITITVGETYQVAGLEAGEVLSVQGGAAFGYELTIPQPTTAPPGDPDPSEGQTLSDLLTWTCTGDPCPWGTSVSGHAIVWPDEAEPVDGRLGYTVSGKAYLPAEMANSAIIWVTTGTATLYAGRPDASSHRALATLGAGSYHEVSGLMQGETLSVQGSISFGYAIALPDPPPGTDPQESSTEAAWVTWNCTGTPCPWGPSVNGYALVWPDSAQASSARLGYTVSRQIYLPPALANGLIIRMVSGTASLYAGFLGDTSHRKIVTLGVGDLYQVSGLASGEVLSAQDGNDFAYEIIALGDGNDPNAPPSDGPPPVEGAVIDSVNAFWRCNSPGCTEPDWTGSVVSWPSWSAYSTNNRYGSQSRTVYSVDGSEVHPYMGNWADGCEVTAVSGNVLIIEWERGTEVWRETHLGPGQTYVIDLIGSEDGAMIETNEFPEGFSVTLRNCTPQPLP